MSNVLSRVEHVSQQHTATGLADIDWERLGFCFWFGGLPLFFGVWSRIFGAS